MNARRKLIVVALGMAFAAVQANENDVVTVLAGKRVDNARVDLLEVTPPAEVQPPLSFPLPSGVTLADALTMRAAAASLPATPAAFNRALQESDIGGALFESGQSALTPQARQALAAWAKELRGRTALRLAVTGHTDNQRLSANARKIYRDNQGLSEARALIVAAHLRELLGLSAEQIATDGYGESRPLTSNATPTGMQRNRRVEIRAWFDEPVAAPVVTPPASLAPCQPQVAPAGVLPFRVTVDGEPVALGGSGAATGAADEADRQRCTDVALEQADIQVRFDSLAIAPALNAWALPNPVERGGSIEFRAWSNYLPWIRKAELRFFAPGQRVQETPLAITPMAWEQPVRWQLPPELLPRGADRLFFVLRVYDEAGRFDETAMKSVDVVARVRPQDDLDLSSNRDKRERETLAGYGENSLSLRNIPVAGGTVTVNGRHLAEGQQVEALGQRVPVDRQGRFAIKQILPAGPHSIEVKVSDQDGKVSAFRRNLTIADSDWFYMAIGDLTVGRNNVIGPAPLVTGDTQHYQQSTYVDGRGAFYLKGKIKGEWLLTAAADTREGPLRDLFSNFSSKDPRYLLRNINPDAYYPVYGDDSTTVADAPTQGKFYVRLERGDSHVLWGNFQTSWSGSELIQYSRGLYGAKGRYRSTDTTSQGEKVTAVDAFAASPGTLGARDEFRGTGGSLYYLRRQDITVGSEKVWIEVRDADSGMVIERKQLQAAQDYEVNYLQGRITLREPLGSTAASSSLFMGSSLGGNPVYLVTTYEFAPGLEAIKDMATGLRATHWVNDSMQVGMTNYHQGEGQASQTLSGVDATLRYKPGTYMKVESARSVGAGSGSSTSIDGGFGFNSQSSTGGNAGAQRVEAVVDLAEVTEDTKGRASAYWQNKDRGFSSPGQLYTTTEAVRQIGAKASVKLAEGTTIETKVDQRNAESTSNGNAEIALRQMLNETWQGSVGLRRDNRQMPVANASSLLSQTGGRTDVIARADYLPLKEGSKERDDWHAYGFVQGTAAHSGTREENNRAGVGGGWRVNDRLKLLAEGSEGSSGFGGRLGTDYRMSDRSNAYLNYALETENPNNAWRGRQGTWVSGTTTRVSDEMRVFGETRASHGAGPQSLTQAFGLDLAPNDRWAYGAKLEVGTISDPAGGDLKRRAIGLSTSYKEGPTKYTGSIELRNEHGNVAGQRNTWLLRNTWGHQATPEWRLLGKLNVSRSSNSQGAFYDGDFHEIVAAAAYRPVDNDRWNTLFKYTNFYNLPSPGQLTLTGAVADYAQKSQVLAVDTIYDLRPTLSLGGKYAVRIGDLKPTKTVGEWYSSQAQLLVLRADWHWVKEWSALAELRTLKAREAGDTRSGWLTALYRRVDEHVKVGVGYNFTNYSDDLTDLSYRSRGWFFNVLGTY